MHTCMHGIRIGKLNVMHVIYNEALIISLVLANMHLDSLYISVTKGFIVYTCTCTYSWWCM